MAGKEGLEPLPSKQCKGSLGGLGDNQFEVSGSPDLSLACRAMGRT